MHIKPDDLRGAQIIELLQAHRASMFAHSPPESVHALDLDGLRKPEITFWSAWEADELLGCGALKELDATQAEIKSMRTVASQLRKGVAASMLQHIVQVARDRGYQQLLLETGTAAAFLPARTLYDRHGFTYCGPFADYVEDPFSVFMCLPLDKPTL